MELGLDDAKILIVNVLDELDVEIARMFIDEGASVVVNSSGMRLTAQADLAILRETSDRVFALTSTDSLSEDELLTRACDLLGGLDVVLIDVRSSNLSLSDALDPKAWAARSERTILRTIGLLREARNYLQHSSEAAVLLMDMSEQSPYSGLLEVTMRATICTLGSVLARQWQADGIRINCIYNAGIETAENSQYKTVMLPIEMSLGLSGVAVFLCSQAASYFTGHSIPVSIASNNALSGFS